MLRPTKRKQGDKPLYQQVVEAIRADIRAGRYKPGDKLPTQHQLCKLTGASRITVVKAMNILEQTGLVSQQPGRGTFVLPSSANSIEKSRVGLLIPQVANDSFFNDILHGIEDELLKHQVSLVLKLSHRNPERERSALLNLAENGCAGILLFISDPETGWLNVREILERNIPIVLLDHGLPGLDEALDTVTSDSLQGAFEATQHLIQLGHRRLAMISSKERFSSVIQREEGFRIGLAAAGLTFDQSMILRGNCTTHLDSGIEIAARLLELPQRPTGVLAMNDALAIGAMRLFKSKGLVVPRDISIVGFDDLKESALLDIALTTVRQDKEGMGRAAVSILINSIKAGYCLGHHKVLPTELIVRASTAPPTH